VISDCVASISNELQTLWMRLCPVTIDKEDGSRIVLIERVEKGREDRWVARAVVEGEQYDVRWSLRLLVRSRRRRSFGTASAAVAASARVTGCALLEPRSGPPFGSSLIPVLA
jgi:hypothetical protein